ncbi:hypothetical protein BH09ACT8_BH09ACT8_21130 [soil metagenome]
MALAKGPLRHLLAVKTESDITRCHMLAAR